MDIEPIAMRNFLAKHPPYSQLDAAARSGLFILRKGATQLRAANGTRISTMASAVS